MCKGCILTCSGLCLFDCTSLGLCCRSSLYILGLVSKAITLRSSLNGPGVGFFSRNSAGWVLDLLFLPHLLWISSSFSNFSAFLSIVQIEEVPSCVIYYWAHLVKFIYFCLCISIVPLRSIGLWLLMYVFMLFSVTLFILEECVIVNTFLWELL